MTAPLFEAFQRSPNKTAVVTAQSDKHSAQHKGVIRPFTLRLESAVFGAEKLCLRRSPFLKRFQKQNQIVFIVY